jgi:hypothetical protein
VTDEPQVAIRAHFERFPATVKGAFVVQAVDGDPHQVVIRGARLVEAAGDSDRAIELPRVTLQAAPRSDLFVPFEFGVTELTPGWYGLQVDVDVDGRPLTVEAGKHFAVAWPRASVRRGAVRVDGKIGADDGRLVSVDHVDCAGDSIKVHFVADAPVVLRLAAGARPLPLLGTEYDEDSGAGVAPAYPVLRSDAMLRIELADPGHGASAGALDVALP